MHARARFAARFLAGLLWLAASCSSESGPNTNSDVAIDSGGHDDATPRADDVAADATGDTSEAPSYLAFWELHQANAMEFEVEAGHWLEDFGDAAYYGPAFFALAGVAYGRDDYLALAEAGVAYSRDIVVRSAGDMATFLARLDEGLMSAFGLAEYLAATGSDEGREALEAYVDRVNETATAFGTYLDVALPSDAAQFYGPTTMTAVAALLNLRMAQLLGGPRAAERTADGIAILDVIEERVWSGTFYRFRPDEEKLFLYPNVVLVIANGVAWQLTGEDRFRERALAVHAALRPLYDADKRAYRSPYSADYMGAQTDDYITLSSQNFTIMALTILHEMTDDRAFVEEIDGIGGFVENRLYDPAQHRILHHWMDGAIAQPEHTEYWCSGCNLQFLYVILRTAR